MSFAFARENLFLCEVVCVFVNVVLNDSVAGQHGQIHWWWNSIKIAESMKKMILNGFSDLFNQSKWSTCEAQSLVETLSFICSFHSLTAASTRWWCGCQNPLIPAGLKQHQSESPSHREAKTDDFSSNFTDFCQSEDGTRIYPAARSSHHLLQLVRLTVELWQLFTSQCFTNFLHENNKTSLKWDPFHPSLTNVTDQLNAVSTIKDIFSHIFL